MRPLAACIRCGSLRLRALKASEGGLGVAFFERSKCRDCGWQGTPFEFPDEASWKAFAGTRPGTDRANAQDR
jgi:hypothetical protein